MSERMNKERAREILKTIRHNSTMQTDYTIDNIDQALDIAIDSLDNEWVDVRDRLPSESGTYLVSLNGVWKKDYCKFWFFGKDVNGEMGWDEFEGYEDIIAWRPLPHPYERKE